LSINSSKFYSYLIFAVSFFYFASALYYYTTGIMGTMFWVLVLVPVAFILYTLEKLKDGNLYPRLGKFQYAVGFFFIAQ